MPTSNSKMSLLGKCHTYLPFSYEQSTELRTSALGRQSYSYLQYAVTRLKNRNRSPYHQILLFFGGLSEMNGIAMRFELIFTVCRRAEKTETKKTFVSITFDVETLPPSDCIYFCHPAGTLAVKDLIVFMASQINTAIPSTAGVIAVP